MQKKAAVINDFTSFGRCSLAVTIPILSAMKVQCCAVPTAIFTNHTGYPSFSWTDYTSHMDDYITEWKKLDLKFDAIMTGFLGSQAQVDYVKRFVKAFKDHDTLICVDPVMGDYGRLYPTYNEDLAKSMRGFLEIADILTPNLTEACVLADVEYSESMDMTALEDIARKLCSAKASKVVISGIPRADKLINFVYEKGKAPKCVAEPKIGADRSGTGDIFASVILADAINHVDFTTSVEKASRFVSRAVARSVELDIPVKDGLAFEEVLGDLIRESAYHA